MKYLAIFVMSVGFVFLGCSDESGKALDCPGCDETAGTLGHDPDGFTAYPATIYGTISWPYNDATWSCWITVWDANGKKIADEVQRGVSHEGMPYNLCDCNLSTESPLPWIICAYAEHGSVNRRDVDTIYSLDTWYDCGGYPFGVKKKAAEVNLVLLGYGGCE